MGFKIEIPTIINSRKPTPEGLYGGALWWKRGTNKLNCFRFYDYGNQKKIFAAYKQLKGDIYILFTFISLADEWPEFKVKWDLV